MANLVRDHEGVRTTDECSEDIYDDAFLSIKRDGAGPDAWRSATAKLQSYLGDHAFSLYDVGAGDGSYLKLAQDEFGLKVTGNEVEQAATVIAQERNGIGLEYGELSALGHDQEFDAATLWCVLAHVEDGDGLLGDVRTLLRPGGVLFLQTPRWSGGDAAASLLQRASSGRASRLVDRRLAGHHWVLHTKESVRRQLERVGYEVLEVIPQVRYTLSSTAYLESLHVPRSMQPAGAWLMDQAIEKRMFPRIVLDVYARRSG